MKSYRLYLEDKATEKFHRTTHTQEGTGSISAFAHVEGKGWLGEDGVYRSQKPRNLSEAEVPAKS